MQSQNESKEAEVPILMAGEADFRSSDDFQG